MNQEEGWYFAGSNGEREGPVSRSTLQALRASGKVTSATLVWHAGMATWESYGAAIEGGAPPPLTGDASSPGAATAASVATGSYAPLWRRALASLVDSILLTIAALIVGAILGVVIGDSASGILLVQGVAWIGMILYYTLMNASSKQGTLGKQAMEIKVATLQGERIGIGRSLGRFLGTWLSTLLLGLGYLMAFFTGRRQALHDMMAGTIVVTRETGPESVALGLPKPRTGGADVAALLLVGILPIGGILAAIAIPAYQDYLIRAQVSDALLAAAPYKTAVEEGFANGTDELTLPDEPGSRFVESIDVQGGVVTVNFGQEAHAKLAGTHVALVPAITEDNTLVWSCGSGAPPEGASPVVENPADYTDTDARYLPSACR